LWRTKRKSKYYTFATVPGGGPRAPICTSELKYSHLEAD
jgi:hypothetical protein